MSEIDKVKMQKALDLMAEARKVAATNPKRADVLRAQADAIFEELDAALRQEPEAVTA